MSSVPSPHTTVEALEQEIRRQHRAAGPQPVPACREVAALQGVVVTDIRLPFRAVFVLVLKVMLAQALIGALILFTLFVLASGSFLAHFFPFALRP